MKPVTVRNLLAVLAIVGAMLAYGAPADARRPVVHRPAIAAPADQAVEVLWGGQWWKANVIGKRAGFTKIHYVGWSDDYDEWVEDARVRTAAQPAAKHPRVDILWGGRWWPGEILDRRSGLVKVHYIGWGSQWDQWVEPKRLR